MTLTYSTMLKLGTKASEFSLPEVVSGEVISLDDFKDKKAFLVMFICRHCPYVKHVQAELARLGRDYQNRNIAIVAICANDAQIYPEDSKDSLVEMKKERGFIFPLLYDESQEVAKAYTAACTPDFFLFNKDRKLVYRGQLDDSRPGNNIPTTGKDVRRAIEAVLTDKEIDFLQRKSIGCNIKWKAGNEPSDFK